MPVQYLTVGAIVLAFVLAAFAVHLVHGAVHRALDRMEGNSAVNRAALHQRAKKLVRTVMLLAYGVAALASISLALSWVGVGEAQLDPRLGAARFQLYNMYRQAGRTPDATAALETFQRLKKENEGSAIAEDPNWCNYAEVYDPPIAPAPAPVLADTAFSDKVLPGEVDAKTAGMTVIDSTGAGDADLLVWSTDRSH